MYYHVYQDQQGLWRWRLRATEERDLAVSGEGHASREECLGSIARLTDAVRRPLGIEQDLGPRA